MSQTMARIVVGMLVAQLVLTGLLLYQLMSVQDALGMNRICTQIYPVEQPVPCGGSYSSSMVDQAKEISDELASVRNDVADLRRDLDNGLTDLLNEIRLGQ
jgi:hypothetical protein